MEKINGDISKIVLKNGRNYTIRSNRDRFFFPKEWMKTFDEFKKKQKVNFDILLNTGARITEARNIKVGDIDFGNKRLIIRVTKVKAKKKEVNPRPRTIPISTQFARRLKKYTYDKMNDQKIGLLSIPGSNLALKKALRRAEIIDFYMFSNHNIRKTLETWLLALGVDSVKISAHMGHDISTAIQHYASPDVFTWQEKQQIREIIGDLYADMPYRW